MISLTNVHAAIAAATTFKASHNRLDALAQYARMQSSPPTQFPSNSPPPAKVIDDDLLETMLGQMVRGANRYESSISADRATTLLLSAQDVLVSHLTGALGIIRRLNCQQLPSNELYAIEAALNALSQGTNP